MTPGALQHTVDDQGEPWLMVTFEFIDATLRAWVHVERQLKLWASQELRPHDDGGWRLTGPVGWTDDHWERVRVTVRIRSRPGVDGQLHRLGPLISRTLPILPSWLQDALADAQFEARTTRGRSREVIKARHNQIKAERRRLVRSGAIELRELSLGWDPSEWARMTAQQKRDELRDAGFTPEELDERDVLDLSARNVQAAMSQDFLMKRKPTVRR